MQRLRVEDGMIQRMFVITAIVSASRGLEYRVDKMVRLLRLGLA